MTTAVSAPLELHTTSMTLRPRYEGSNICTWIGFKHVNYLVEEAVLDYFRQHGHSARELFERHGVGVEIVDIDTRILHALHMDDVVIATVKPRLDGQGALRLQVTADVDRPEGKLKAVTSKVAVSLRVDTRHGAGEVDVPVAFRAAVVRRIGAVVAPVTAPQLVAREAVSTQVPAELRNGDGPAIAWRRRIPYFYCHHTVRLQMSGLLRQLEQVVDLFLDERGASIRTLLDEQDWIPVVPHSRIEMTGEAYMEEDLLTVFEVEDVFKGFTYTARMDCYAIRGGLVKVATGRITHGYAHIDGRGDWSLVDFDDRLLKAVGAR